MNHTLSESQLEAMIKSAVNSSGPLPPDEKFSQLISALRELQERRKAALDSEPVQNHVGSKNALDAIVSFIKSKSNPTVKCYEEVSEQLFKDNCHGIHSHVIEYILKLGEELEDLRAEQAEMLPVTEYPEVLPCSVLLEPWLRFGKGIKTSTMLSALARRALYESDMAALSPEERAEFQERIEDFKALIAQPAPVVPQDVLDALQKVARIRLELNDFDGDRRGIADCLCDAEEALIEVVNRRAAMLDPAPQLPGSEPATVPGKWIPVSERMPEAGGDMIVFTDGIVMSGVSYAKKKGFYIQALEYDDDEPVDSVTHWMPLPAAPREAK